MSNHVHSFGPRGRALCACGMTPERPRIVQEAADACEKALYPLTGAERKAVWDELKERGLLTWLGWRTTKEKP